MSAWTGTSSRRSPSSTRQSRHLRRFPARRATGTPAVPSLEPAKALQEVFIDHTIVDDTGTLSRNASHVMIMPLAKAKSPRSRPHTRLPAPPHHTHA